VGAETRTGRRGHVGGQPTLDPFKRSWVAILICELCRKGGVAFRKRVQDGMIFLIASLNPPSANSPRVMFWQAGFSVLA
jgi:hypothetical protein